MISTQVYTLLSVALGALCSFLITSFGDRTRERRMVAREWRERRLEIYSRYILEVKKMRNISERIAADVGLDKEAPPMSRDEGLPFLAQANIDRSLAFESVILVGGKGVVEAGRELNRSVWRLEWFARGLLDDNDQSDWKNSLHECMNNIDKFHILARKDLGISGPFSPRYPEPPPANRSISP